MSEELKPCPYAEILTKDGTKVLVDESDVSLVSQYRWRFGKNERYVRAWDNVQKRMVAIHRLILGFPEGGSIDHINGNPTDNRRSNLRICSQSQNMKNRRRNENSTTGFKGVTQIREGRFRAKIGNEGERINLGVYGSARDAAIAYNAGAKVLHGDFAYPNDIPPPQRAKPVVKALEFVQNKIGSFDAVGWCYWIAQNDGDEAAFWAWGYAGDVLGEASHLPAAIAAVQGEHTRRVHACLDGYDD